MTPAARVAAAIDVLTRLDSGEEPIDRVLAGWGRQNRYAGSGDRRAIADLVYDTVRRWRSSAWVAGQEPGPRASMIGNLRLNGADPGTLFSGQRHAPALLAPEEAAIRRLADAPPAVRLDIPDWLAPQLADVPEEALAMLRDRAPLDLRVNTLKVDRSRAQAALSEDGIITEPVALSPTALRVVEGARRLPQSRSFTEGLVEPMDAASQAVADHAAPGPEQTVLDLCAGAGGKTLAMAALMHNRGRLLAHDASAARLARLPPRADRAGVMCECIGPEALPAMQGKADLVLVDAPCSGSGTWRRTPDAKWRLDPASLDELTALQARILAEAAPLVAPGGRLVYATCSLLPSENIVQIEAFTSTNPNFAPDGPPLSLTPLDGGDGFFAQALRRSG